MTDCFHDNRQNDTTCCVYAAGTFTTQYIVAVLSKESAAHPAPFTRQLPFTCAPQEGSLVPGASQKVWQLFSAMASVQLIVACMQLGGVQLLGPTRGDPCRPCTLSQMAGVHTIQTIIIHHNQHNQQVPACIPNDWICVCGLSCSMFTAVI